MAINIFKKEITKTTDDSSKNILKAFELFVEYKNSLVNLLEIKREHQKEIQDKEILFYMDVDTHEIGFKEIINHSVETTNKLPIMINTKFNESKSLINTKIAIPIIKYLTTSDEPNVIQNFVNELDNLKDQFVNIKTTEKDSKINIAVYPTLKHFIDKYMKNYIIMDDKYMFRDDIKHILQDIYQIVINVHTSKIIKKHCETESPNLNKLNQTQQIKYPHLDYCLETQPLK